MDKLDKEALASGYQGIDELDREALNWKEPMNPTEETLFLAKIKEFKTDEEKCPYCGNLWDSKYTNHSICGLG